VVTYVAVFALILAYGALVAAYAALRSLARLRRSTAVLARGTRSAQGRETQLEATERHATATLGVAEELSDLRAHVDASAAALLEAVTERTAVAQRALSRVALVRYNALAEMSGRMSFSLALLDESGDGLTISAIAGRSDTSVYAKAVAAGRGQQELSPEEQQAVKAAMTRKVPAAVAPAPTAMRKAG
jgi:hypothetical protein